MSGFGSNPLDGRFRCYRCKRELHPWPLRRADVCAPKGWVHCIRWPGPKDKPIDRAPQPETALPALDGGEGTLEAVQAPDAPKGTQDTLPDGRP